MTHAQAKTRHAQLAEEIRRHDHAYYTEAKPTISDQAYDRLYHELLEAWKRIPGHGDGGFAEPAGEARRR